VFDLEGGWAARMPEEEFGPHIEFREFSFLQNFRLPAAVNQTKVVVEMCPPGTQGCSDGKAPAVVEVGPPGSSCSGSGGTLACMQPPHWPSSPQPALPGRLARALAPAPARHRPARPPAPVPQGVAPNQRVRVQQGLDSMQLAVALREVGSSRLLHFMSMKNAFAKFTDQAAQQRFFKRMQRYTSIWCCVAAHPGHIHYDMWWDTPHTDKFGRQWESWTPKTGP
jgi:hypothetical protein